MLSNYRRRVDQLLAEYDYATKSVREEKKTLQKAQTDLSATIEARQAIQEAAETVQQQAHRKIAQIVTRCLECVFSDPYKFEIRFSRKRGKTEAKLVFVRDGLELEDPTNESGGGPVQVAAFALRLACLVLSRPQKRLFLALDEPFMCISKDNRNRVRQLIRDLSREMNVQFLIVTQEPDFQMGKVIEIG